jgi:hypothetical protein
MADAELALSQGEADANLAWIQSKDLADQKFATTDAEDWEATIDEEGKAQFEYTLADDAATADDEDSVAQAQAGQTTSDTSADATQGESDASESGDFEKAEAGADATVMGWLAAQPSLEVPNASGTLVPSPWMAFEAELAQVRAQYESTAAADEEQYADTVGSDETNYATTDTDAFLSEVATILSDDLSASVGGGSGTSASDQMAGHDLTLLTTTDYDERIFETTLAPDAQAYQDTLAQDAHDYQYAVAQATHDLAVGTIDSATYDSEVQAAADTQTTDDAAAAALYQSQVGGATVTQLEDDADAALTDATENASAVKSAADGDALATEDYTTAESNAYEVEVTGDATALDGEQTGEANAWLSAVEQLATYNFSPWNDSPWVQQILAQAQAQANLVDGTGTQEGTAQAEMDQTDQEAAAQNTQETDDAGAQYTRDLAADLDQYNLTVGDAQATHDAEYAMAATDQALVTAGAFPADLPGNSSAPDDGAPITATANYGLVEDIGGYSMGPAGGDYQGLVGGMFAVGPNTEPGYTGWTGWYGWEPAYSPPVPANSTSGPTAASASASGTSGGTWSSDGATPPPQAPQMLAFTDGAPGSSAKSQDEAGGTAGGGAGNSDPNATPGSIEDDLASVRAQAAGPQWVSDDRWFYERWLNLAATFWTVDPMRTDTFMSGVEDSIHRRAVHRLVKPVVDPIVHYVGTYANNFWNPNRDWEPDLRAYTATLENPQVVLDAARDYARKINEDPIYRNDQMIGLGASAILGEILIIKLGAAVAPASRALPIIEDGAGNAVLNLAVLGDTAAPLAVEEVLVLDGALAGVSGEAAASPVASILVPGGGLAAHEGGAIRAHTLRLHVAQEEPALAMRLHYEPTIPATGTFSSRAVAELAISDTLKANEGLISSWLAGSNPALPALRSTLWYSPGVSLLRGTNESVPAYIVIVVLRRDASMPTGYRILTSYPIAP